MKTFFKKVMSDSNYRKSAIASLLLIILVVVGVTYAYFVGQIGSGTTANVRATSATVDTLTFSAGNPINLNANKQNFTRNGSNLVGQTTASATLRANNTTNEATETYNVYFKINSNNYIRTSSSPELILEVTDPSGNPVTIDGLTQVTVGSVTGYDVTTKSGLITIASDYEISVANAASNPTSHTWNFKLTYINLETNQYENGGAVFSAEAIINKPGSGFKNGTGTIYRYANNQISIGDVIGGNNTVTVQKWCPTDGIQSGCEQVGAFETETECNGVIDNAISQGYINEGDFTCEQETIEVVQFDAWCPTNNEYNGCNDDWYYDTQADCNEGLAYEINDGYINEGDFTCTQGTVSVPASVYYGDIGEYTTNSNEIDKDVYLKHEVDNNVVQSSFVCFIKNNNEYCLQGGDEGDSYETNKSTLIEAYDGDEAQPYQVSNKNDYYRIIKLSQSLPGACSEQENINIITSQEQKDYLIMKLAQNGNYRLTCDNGYIFSEVYTDGIVNVRINDNESIKECRISSSGQSACFGDSSGGDIIK